MTISNDSVERRDIWWIENLGGKVRPAIVISSDFYNANPRNTNIVVVPLTSLKPTSKLRDDEVLIEPEESGLEEASITMVSDLQTVTRQRLVEWAGAVSDELVHLVDACVRWRLGF